MKHFRTRIRKRILDILKANVDLGENWKASQPNPAFLKQLPIGLIYYETETANHKGSSPRYYERKLSLNIDVLTRDGLVVDVEDFLDDRAFEIEQIMFLNEELLTLPNQEPLAYNVELASTNPYTIESEGDNMIAGVRLSWIITYETLGEVHGTIDEFLKFNAQYNNESGQELAEDNVIIRTS